MHKENHALWNIKHLHTKLVGDHIWVPTELMETPNDIHFFQEPRVANGQSLGQRSVNSDGILPLLEGVATNQSTNGQPSINGEGLSLSHNGDSQGNGTSIDADASMVDADVTIDEETAANESTTNEAEGTSQGRDRPLSNATPTETNGDMDVDRQVADPDQEALGKGKPTTNGATKIAEQNGGFNYAQSLLRSLNGNGSNLPGSAPMSIASVDGLDDMFIHPIFLAPKSAQPHRDLGIPEAEAEDLRRLLQAYVQKQEEVCRGSKRLHEGLLRAERLRKTVFQWSKYEAHAGTNRDMSDGEDWYDKEEWGLDEDLKKGADEEEEDTTQQPKKTRARK